MGINIVVQVLLGLALLLAGRKLFWVFMGVVGFIAGYGAAMMLLTDQTGWTPVLIALGSGILGIVIARLLQKLAVVAAGFIAGAYIGYFVVHDLGWAAAIAPWVLALICGVAGAVFLSLLFDWALIMLTSLAGAAIVAQAPDVSSLARSLLFLCLLGIGLIIQIRQHLKKIEKKQP
jgi:hypothetical protein